MRIKERVKYLEERKGTLPTAERFEASLAIFRLVHEREPTQAEIDEIRAEIEEQKRVSIPQRIKEIEAIVYEDKTE